MTNEYNEPGAVNKYIVQSNQTRDNIYATANTPGNNAKCRLFIGNDSRSLIGFTKDNYSIEANLSSLSGEAYSIPVFSDAYTLGKSRIIDSPALGLLGELESGDIEWTTHVGDITISAGIGTSESGKGHLNLIGLDSVKISGYTGIGGDADLTDWYQLYVHGGIRGTGNILIDTLGSGIFWGSSACGMQSDASGNLFLRAGGADRMEVQASNGYIGVLKSSPDYPIDVTGSINISSGSHYKINGTNLAYSDVGAFPATHGVSANYLARATSTTAFGNSLLQDNGTNVGIGMSPGYTLDVYGDVNIKLGSHYKINGVNLAASDIGADPAGTATAAINAALSGASGYVAKFNGDHSVVASQILDNGTNVGIGMSPGYTLDVYGDVNIKSGSHYKINGTNLAYSDVGAFPATHGVSTNYLACATSTTAFGNSLLQDDGTTVTLNKTTANAIFAITASQADAVTARLELKNDYRNYALISSSGENGGAYPGAFFLYDATAKYSRIAIGGKTGTNAGNLYLGGNIDSSNGTFDGAAITVLPSGKIGIDSTAPGYLLTVGHGAATGKVIIHSGDSGCGQLQIGNSTTGGECSIGFLSGVTAFGSSPTAASDNNIWVIGVNAYGCGSNKWGIGNKACDKSVLTVVHDGKVGIGTTEPDYLLEMESSGGGYYSASDHQWHNGSSRAIKKNIEANRIDVMTILDNLNIVQFNYKTEEDSELKHIGFIAEETDPLLSSKEQNGQATADCVGFLLAVVKELKSRIEELAKEKGYTAW